MKYSTILSAALFVPLGIALPTANEDVIEEVLDLPLGETSSVNETESDIVSRQAGCYIQAFTGAKCDNSAGARRTVTNRGGICFVATGRQSYRVSVECRGGLNIGYSRKTDCSNPYLYKRHGPGACVHVDTGKAWGSSSVSF
ncbi:uncharacterized protein RHO25_002932 [Cercospora beticola]|uniref:Uncharacterized protein n=1 Tax=Cercospora beticola TaxID=122368 RepID=A0ABZ0NFK3_CERBT|nr:hypothetical protein RHO25_002932 [Cercospora beticola]